MAHFASFYWHSGGRNNGVSSYFSSIGINTMMLLWMKYVGSAYHAPPVLFPFAQFTLRYSLASTHFRFGMCQSNSTICVLRRVGRSTQCCVSQQRPYMAPKYASLDIYSAVESYMRPNPLLSLRNRGVGATEQSENRPPPSHDELFFREPPVLRQKDTSNRVIDRWILSLRASSCGTEATRP